MRTFWGDVRYGTRRLAAQPVFLTVAVVTLALAVGATTAIYSVIDALILRPLPYPRPITQILIERERGMLVPSIGYEAFAEWRRHPEIFERVEAYSQGSHVLAGGAEPRLVPTASLTGGLMDMIGAVPQLGRILHPSDSTPGRERVAVLSDRLWRENFGAAADIIGRSVRLDDKPYEIVGVMRRDFRFPHGLRDIWLPLPDAPPAPGTRGPRYDTIAVMAPGLSLAAAQERIDAVSAALAAERPTPLGWTTKVRPFQERRVNAPIARALYILFAAVAVLLLIACANLANLLLVQGAGRERELAVRAALGARRSRLVSQLLAETLVLAVLGGGAGVFVALWGVDLFAGLAPSDLTFLSVHDLAVDGRGLLFALVLTLTTALGFGIVPALRSSRTALDQALKSATRSTSGGRAHRRLRDVFVVAQLAMSLVLLIGGGLLARTFIGLTRADPGFDAEGLVAATMMPPSWKYGTPAARQEFYRQATERLLAVPGVQGVTLASGAPPGGGGISFGMKLEVEGRGVVLDDPELLMPFADVTAGYFEVLRIPIIAGRAFAADEGADAVIVNESMARRLWGDPSGAIGTRWRTSGRAPWRTVVGVAGDVFQFDHMKPRGGIAVYYPIGKEAGWGGQMSILVRSAPGAAPPLEAIRQQIWSVDPAQAIYELSTITELYDEFFGVPRFYALLMSLFAVIGACIAAVGLYGVLAYSVAQRRREFGIRLALGARRQDVLRLAFGQGARVTLAGLALGTVASLMVSQVLESMVVDLSPNDPWTYGGMMVILAAVAAVASWFPSRRAASVDPSAALRQE